MEACGCQPYARGQRGKVAVPNRAVQKSLDKVQLGVLWPLRAAKVERCIAPAAGCHLRSGVWTRLLNSPAVPNSR
jgi:hypothetical protein